MRRRWDSNPRAGSTPTKRFRVFFTIENIAGNQHSYENLLEGSNTEKSSTLTHWKAVKVLDCLGPKFDAVFLKFGEKKTLWRENRREKEEIIDRTHPFAARKNEVICDERFR